MDSVVRGKAMTKHAGQMDARIAAAFTDSATSDDVGGLVAEVEAAVNPSSDTVVWCFIADAG